MYKIVSKIFSDNKKITIISKGIKHGLRNNKRILFKEKGSK
jgi:hypothetical protein